MYINGTWNKNGAGMGVVLLTLDFNSIETVIRLDFTGSNNKAEYEALVVRLLMSRELWVRKLNVQDDSSLVINQTNNSYEVKDDRMLKYKELVTRIIASFDEVKIEKIDKLDNEAADKLAVVTSIL